MILPVHISTCSLVNAMVHQTSGDDKSGWQLRNHKQTHPPPILSRGRHPEGSHVLMNWAEGFKAPKGIPLESPKINKYRYPSPWLCP